MDLLNFVNRPYRICCMGKLNNFQLWREVAGERLYYNQLLRHRNFYVYPRTDIVL